MILTNFGIGSYTHESLSLIGGEVLTGAAIDLFKLRWPGMVVIMPTFGWSGWRTLDEPTSFRANTFTGRFDLGYFDDDRAAHELQSNFTHHVGAWCSDLRFVAAVNPVPLVVALFASMLRV